MRFWFVGIRLAAPVALLLCLVAPAVFLLCLVAPAHGETLTVEAAVSRALASYPAIGVSRADSDEALAGIDEAQAAWFPTIQATGVANRFEEPMAVYPIHGFRPGLIPPFDRTIYQGALSLSYTLFDGGARGARIRQAKERLVAANAVLDGTGQSVTERVVATYLDVLGRKEILDAHDRRLEALQSERMRVRQLRDVGRAAPVEILRVDAAIASAEAERVTYATALDVAEAHLARLIGGSVEETRVVHLAAVALADTTQPDGDRIIAAALAANPMLEQARARHALAAAGSLAARGARYPSVALGASYNGWADSDWNDRYEWNAAAQLAMPLFTGGAIRSRVAQADAARQAAAEQLRLSEIELRQEIDRALSLVAAAHARVRSLASAVASMTEVARIESLALSAGSGMQTDYLDSEADLLAARANLAGARHREIETRVNLARITGQLSLDWLAQNLEHLP